MKADLSKRDIKYRDYFLNGPTGKVVLYVCSPLMLYQMLNQVFKILDAMMAAHISVNAVSSVAYLSQISTMLSAIGGGLAVGAGIKISEAYGAGDYELVRRRVSTLYTLSGILGGLLLLILVPFASPFLRMMNTPEEFIAEGTTYFIVELFGMAVMFFNNVYMAVERARGNSKRIFWLNLGVIGVKLVLTAVFVYGFHCGLTMISVATLLAQIFLFAAAFINMNQKDNAFGFSFRAISFRREITAPMLKLSIPVIISKMAFAMGKVIVNSMSTVYGSATVGALGISNNISGFTTSPQNGIQDGGSPIISQNLGASKTERALTVFCWAVIINLIESIVMMSLSLIFLNQIVSLFSGSDPDFAVRIIEIYRVEVIGVIPLGINAAVLSLLYGFGKTKITLLMNFCRIFLFRVPVLYALQQLTDLGNVSAGIVMAVSNTASGVLALVVAFCVIRKICRKQQISFLHVLRHLNGTSAA